jgi:hypothetical protein
MTKRERLIKLKQLHGLYCELYSKGLVGVGVDGVHVESDCLRSLIVDEPIEAKLRGEYIYLEAVVDETKFYALV